MNVAFKATEIEGKDEAKVIKSMKSKGQKLGPATASSKSIKIDSKSQATKQPSEFEDHLYMLDGIVDYECVWQNYREDALATVAKDGMKLANFLLGFEADKEVVLAAVEKNGSALEYASPELRGEGLHNLPDEEQESAKEVVLAAVAQDGLALRHASEALRANKEVAYAAGAQFVEALRYVSQELKEDEEFLVEVKVAEYKARLLDELAKSGVFKDELRKSMDHRGNEFIVHRLPSILQVGRPTFR
mgnify:CR=1 FL=1